MKTSDLKSQLFSQIELLNKIQLCELSRIVNNLIHGNYGIADWENLSQIEKEGIIDSIKELDSSNGIEHESVMDGIRKKIANA